jgi:hypothetical protein
LQSKNRGVAQLASALAWGARGRKFESSHPDKSKTQLSIKQIVAFFYCRIYTTFTPRKKDRDMLTNITPRPIIKKNPVRIAGRTGFWKKKRKAWSQPVSLKATRFRLAGLLFNYISSIIECLRSGC